jgi:hypothetical protein
MMHLVQPPRDSNLCCRLPLLPQQWQLPRLFPFHPFPLLPPHPLPWCTTTQSIDKGKCKQTKKDDETNTAIQATKSKSVQANHTAEKGKGSAKDGEVKKKPGTSKHCWLNTYVELEEEYKEDEWAGSEAEEEEVSGAEGKSQEDDNDDNNNNNNNDLAAPQEPCAACKHRNLEGTMVVWQSRHTHDPCEL